ncbi:Tat pathway signal protein [Streptomyces sp. NRRL S-646]|uniref:golvesin C-terminal-like domain-containing protein n=1 Tax=Streptomyces sp. NRRL S-646 TaxID=1463917 RepID=UPI001F2C67E9|nr:Tat pathway signal protein [Streptomyces sp. NRRL S-646]
MTTGFRRTAVTVLAVTAALTGLIQAQTATAGTRPTPPIPTPSHRATGGGVKNPDKTLGRGWRTASDRAVTAAADSDGLHLLVADGKNAYSWRTAAVLSEPQLPADTWIGNQCVMDDHHAAVVYAPRTFTNKPDLMMGGAFTAIVNLDDGSVTKLPFTASLAYFDPTCDPATHTAAFTALRDTRTRLVTVNTKGTTVADTSAKGEITSAVPVEDGVIAAAGNRLVHIDRKGTTTELTATSHAPYGIRVRPDGTVGYLDRTGDTKANVKTYAHGRTATIATGRLTAMSLRQGTDGTLYLTGKATPSEGFKASGIKPLNVSPDADLSSRGRLAVDPVVSPAVQAGLDHIGAAGKGFTRSRTAEPAPENTPGHIGHALSVIGMVTATGEHTAQTAPEPGRTAGGAVSPSLTGSSSPRLTTVATAGVSLEHNPVDTDRWCSVPRNDVDTQALQPTPNQVEWAVDMAIRGNLRSSYLRQGDWRSQTGIGTIDPQGMFPVPKLNTGGRIPAQVELGILAQESNLWQAESGAIPGQMGSPLAAVDGFYGHQTGGSLSDYWRIHWDDADCGYGVGQVTDGMRMAGHEKKDEKARAPEEQRAIAIDYATNIAASLYILADKWNEVHTSGQTVTVNNDDPAKPENWFTAVWNYNLGFNKASAAGTNGNWGLGWYNNPANPVYPAGRLAFMDTDLDHNANQDAAHPQNWPYEEKVMGWAAWSIDTGHSYATSGRQDWPGDSGFSSAGFYPAWWSTTAQRSAIKPPLDTFCNSHNNCDAANPPSCPDAGCYTKYWWHESNATWKSSCSSTCGNEHLKYQTLINEPGRGYRLQYGTPVCSGAPDKSLVVDSVPAGTNTWSSCGKTTSDGSFEFTFYPDPGATGPGLGQYDAKADLHQIGGGYQGHFWYAHSRDADHLGGSSGRMTVLGDWKLKSAVSEGQAAIYAHIPDTGAQARDAVYEVPTALGVAKVKVNQDANEANKWVYLGAFRFNDSAPEVRLSNSTYSGSGDDDIAWDAMAFVPGDYGIPKDHAVDLTLPAVNADSPNPNQADQPVTDKVTKPLKVDNGPSSLMSPQSAATGGAKVKESCGPVKHGGQVCFGRPLDKPYKGPRSGGGSTQRLTAGGPSGASGIADWCDDNKLVARATRTLVCENREVPAYYRKDGEIKATAYFVFQRLIELDGVNSFEEHFTVKPVSIPADFAQIQIGIYKHLCDSPCTPVEADPAAWKGQPSWTAGDMHTAYITSGYTWDNSTDGKIYKFKPDVQINAIIDPVGDETIQTVGYQWSLGGSSGFDEVRCDTMTRAASAGCVLPNYAPTYTFNAAKYPQAAAHAWLIQHAMPNSPGLKSADTPLYYLPGGRDGKNRNVICDESGWARTNYDPEAMNSSTDDPNCDEFSFNASYNSGGMPADLGGLNPVATGAECVQTFAQMDNGTIHLRNLPGTIPSFNEVCGRSAISGLQNSGSMAAFSAGFAKKMRLMQQDAYWLDTAISGDCAPQTGSFIKCTMKTN